MHPSRALDSTLDDIGLSSSDEINQQLTGSGAADRVDRAPPAIAARRPRGLPPKRPGGVLLLASAGFWVVALLIAALAAR